MWIRETAALTKSALLLQHSTAASQLYLDCHFGSSPLMERDDVMTDTSSFNKLLVRSDGICDFEITTWKAG